MQPRNVVAEVSKAGMFGAVIGFYGVSSSRALGLKAENIRSSADLYDAKASPLWGVVVGAAFHFLTSGINCAIFAGYLLGALIGGIAAMLAFDHLNPGYEPSRPKM